MIVVIYRLKNLTVTAETLRKKVVKANGELTRLMNAYELAGVEVVEASSRADMSTWLASDRPRRRAALPPSPGLELTQSTEASNLSQLSGDGKRTQWLVLKSKNSSVTNLNWGLLWTNPAAFGNVTFSAS